MTDIYPVDPAFAAKASIRQDDYQRDYQASVENPEKFWGQVAERLQWFKKPTKIKDVSFGLDDFHIRWFEDGELNASARS